MNIAFAHEVLAAVTPSGVTAASIATQLKDKHPNLNPTWINKSVKDYLNRYARCGRLARSGVGTQTLYALPL